MGDNLSVPGAVWFPADQVIPGYNTSVAGYPVTFGFSGMRRVELRAFGRMLFPATAKQP